MTIYIDGDACNKIDAIEKIAKEKNIQCHIYCNTTKLLESDYSTVHIVDKGLDKTDFAILNKCGTNDIVITNDNGLAAMVLAKKAYAINTRGFEYTEHNIMLYLNNRHLRKQTVQKTNRHQVHGIMPANTKCQNFNKLLINTIIKAERNVSKNA